MKRVERPEEMDRPDVDPLELARGLEQLRQINRWLGGWGSVRQAVGAALPPGARHGALVLDVATGGGDIARALERRWRCRGVRVVALDMHPLTLGYARRRTDARQRIAFVRGDALALPIPTAGVDLALCSLAAHHFSEEEATRLLLEMNRVARRAVVVTDLRRSRLAWVLIWILTRLVWRSPVVRHDGPVSVRRAFTPGELRRLAERAGLHGARIIRQPLFRMALVYRRPQ